jgi:two-component system LytT family response regulator
VSEPLRALIVDDEPIARKGLRILLSRIPETSVLGESGDLQSALEIIAYARPSVIFLDIGLRAESGLDLASRIPPGLEPPAIVYVTAYSQHAVRAFEDDAVDYLLKPVVPERLAAAVAKVRRWLTSRKSQTRIPFRVEGSTRFVVQSEIESVEAAGNYCCVQTTANEQLVIRETLTAVAARLDPNLFVRVHRSFLIATNSVVEVQPLPNRDAMATLRSGKQIRISRQYRQSF